MRNRVVVLALLVTVGLVASAATVTGLQGGEESGDHITLEFTNQQVVNYTVGNQTFLASIQAQSVEQVETDGLQSLTEFEGSAMESTGEDEATWLVNTQSNANFEFNDNPHGTFIAEGVDVAQYARFVVAEGVEATDENQRKVTLTTDGNAAASFILVGDGEVTVNQNGDVVARIGDASTLVFRAYPDGKSNSDEQMERYIENGNGVAEIYARQPGTDSIVDHARYQQDVAPTAEQTDDTTVQTDIEYTEGESGVVLFTLSQAFTEASGAINATVNGQQAQEVTSFGELDGALDGNQSRYMVVELESRTDVIVAVNQFAAQTTVGVSGASGQEQQQTPLQEGDDGNQTDQPGFGVLAAIVALAVAALAAARR